jgi:CHAD domain-containing protein
MMAKELHNSLISYTKDLVKYSEQAGVTFDADLIHELRTTFKKIRALLRWQKIDKNIYAGFKKIYDVAGKLRNVQVVKEMLKKEKDTPQTFKNWLSITQAQLKKEWDEVYHKEILKQFLENIENLKIKFSKHKKFFSKRIQNILHIISTAPFTDNAIHDIRKMTKDMQYVLEWWEKKKNGSNPLIKNISIKQLKNIGEQIGEYNDKRNLLILPTAYSLQEKEPALINEIIPVIHKWQQDKVLQKEKLMIRLHRIAWQTG